MKWPWTKTPQQFSIEQPFQAKLPGPEIESEGRLDVTSESWIFVRTYCEKRLRALREANDGAGLDEKATAVIRGQIKAIKDILDLPKPKPRMHQEEEED